MIILCKIYFTKCIAFDYNMINEKFHILKLGKFSIYSYFVLFIKIVLFIYFYTTSICQESFTQKLKNQIKINQLLVLLYNKPF